MAECADCRDDLVQARSLLESAPPLAVKPRPRRIPRVRTWLAAAGILAVASLPLLQRAARPRDDAPRFRAAPTVQSRIDVVGPDAQSVNAATIVFAWHPIDGASAYRVTMTDSSGTPLFTTVTTDTSVRPAAGTDVHRGKSYLWYVDGLTSGGRTLTSGVRSFTTLP